jgi:hypothetical protein
METQAKDLKIYYSGGRESLAIQDSSLESLGGFRSSVLVPNGRIDSLFDEVGIQEATAGQDICRAIYLRNTSELDTIRHLFLFITGKKEYEQMKFGVSIPESDIAPVQMLQTQNEIPYNVEFLEAYEEAEKVELVEELLPGKSIVLWLNRIITTTTLRKQHSSLIFTFDWS